MNNKKTILIFCDDMHIGGVNSVVYNLINIIPKEEYAITLMLCRKEGEFLKYIPDYVRIITPPYKKGMDVSFGFSFLIKQKIKQKKYFTALRLFLGKFFNCNLLLTKLLFEKQSIKYDYLFYLKSANVFFSFVFEYIYSFEKKYIWLHSEGLLQKEKYNKSLNKYDFIFCVSNELAKKAKKVYEDLSDKMSTLYIPMDVRNILNLSNGDGFKDNYNGCRILSVGRLVYLKGFDIAIKTCKILVDKGYDINWYIVGDGYEKEKLSSLIKENNLEKNFILLGEKENPYPFFKECDIYVQSSRSEGYCLTLAEAKIFNKPIVTTVFPGTYEQIKDNETGIIVETTPECIASGVQKLLDNKELREKLINNLKIENQKPKPDYFAELKKYL